MLLPFGKGTSSALALEPTVASRSLGGSRSSSDSWCSSATDLALRERCSASDDLSEDRDREDVRNCLGSGLSAE